MFSEKISKISLWDNLKNSGKPVVLYGMGDGADKILDCCDRKNIEISGVFASDAYVRGNYFRGFKIKKLSEIEEEYKDFCILTAFATRDAGVIKKIYELNKKYELYSPNFPVFGNGEEYPDYDFFIRNICEAEKAYELLSGDLSRAVYLNSINFMITGKLKYLENIETPKESGLDLLDLRDNLYYIDAGAYNGDTIFELKDYLDTKKINITKIAAFEPDKKNFEKLVKNIPGKLDCELKLYNAGVWNEEKILYFNAKSGRNASLNNIDLKNKTEIKVNALDNIINITDEENRSLLIKYDVEGSEFEALEGSRNIIEKYSPGLIVSLYHRNEDIFKLMLLINDINPGYKFYMRKHRYIPCWDLNLYARQL